MDTPDKLAKTIHDALQPRGPERKTVLERIRSILTHEWKAKLSAFGLVCITWFLLAGQQDFEASLRVPVETRDLPADIQVIEPVDPHVSIRVRGMRKDASTLSERNVQVRLDLSGAVPGKRIYPISRQHVVLNNERVSVVHIRPNRIVFSFKKKNQPSPDQ
jgi:hypothetical protein